MKKRVLAALLVLALAVGLLPTSAAASTLGQDIVDYAATWVGKTPYVYGGNSLTTGADCSGFICAVYEHFGINLWGRRTGLRGFVKDGLAVEIGTDLTKAQPGDIITCWSGGHVAIYAGNGQAIHALNEERDTVRSPTNSAWLGTITSIIRLNAVSGGGSTVCTSHTRGAYMFFEANHPHHSCYKCGICGVTWADRNTSNYYESCVTCTGAGKTSKPSVSVSGSSVTVSWTYSGNATGFTVYLIQAPWGWDDKKCYSTVVASEREYTFTDVPPGSYKAFVIAWPNQVTQQSPWSDLFTCDMIEPDFIPISGVALSANDVNLELGDIYHLVADVIPENATNRDAIIWRSSDESVAIVDDAGNVEGVSVGTAIITATTLDGAYTDACEVTVFGDIPVSGVQLSCGGLIFGDDKVSGIGDGTLETARIIPENATNTACIWTSSDPSVATVTGTGPTAQIEGVGVGTATITVTTVDGGYTDSLTITVCGGLSVDTRDDDVEIRIVSTWISNNSDVAADITIKNNSDKAIDYILAVAAYGPGNQFLGLHWQDRLTIQAGDTSSNTVFLDVPWNAVAFKAFALRDGNLTPLASTAEI